MARPSVCLSSVTFVRPTQRVEIFGNISTPFGKDCRCTFIFIFTFTFTFAVWSCYSVFTSLHDLEAVDSNAGIMSGRTIKNAVQNVRPL